MIIGHLKNKMSESKMLPELSKPSIVPFTRTDPFPFASTAAKTTPSFADLFSNNRPPRKRHIVPASTYPFRDRWDAIQYAYDKSIVILALPIWFLTLMIIMTLKWLIDGRPLLYKQTRVGRHGKFFVLYKIRTTPPHHKPNPQEWPNDIYPPRTTFGRWLRDHDLDEIPQLLNVLKGEMSLVGPRPETPFHMQRISHFLPEYPERLTVLPGISGLSQVRGWRGDTSIKERFVSDKEYVHRKGLKCYVQILFTTAAIEIKKWL
jgi:lipopolysaccharide/colanic/teichoic acid biosynthesis glycosyltransferase